VAQSATPASTSTYTTFGLHLQYCKLHQYSRHYSFEDLELPQLLLVGKNSLGGMHGWENSALRFSSLLSVLWLNLSLMTLYETTSKMSVVVSQSVLCLILCSAVS